MPMSASDNKTRAAAAIIGLIILLLTEGCISIPIKMQDKSKYTEQDLSVFTAELSTKDDVLNKFGPPDIIWETERVYVYRWTGIWGVGMEGTPVYQDQAILVLFDQDDRVVRIEIVSRSPFTFGGTCGEGEYLIKWLNKQKE
jgi:hypothetical protein